MGFESLWRVTHVWHGVLSFVHTTKVVHQQVVMYKQSEEYQLCKFKHM